MMSTVMEKDGILAKAADLCISKKNITRYLGQRTCKQIGDNFQRWRKKVNEACHQLKLHTSFILGIQNLGELGDSEHWYDICCHIH